MTKRRLLGVFFFGGILLATGVVPAGAAPTTRATLAGPNARPCDGPAGTVPVGSATIQSGKAKGVPADQRALRVSVAAENVQPRMTYDVALAATVVTPTFVGCQFWSAGTVAVTGNGRLAFTGAVTVPGNLAFFQVYVRAAVEPADVGYTTSGIDVTGL